MRYVLVGLALTACGGAEGNPLLDGGASDATSGDAASDAQTDAPNCDALLADLQTKSQTAVQCCNTCGTLQCTQQIEGMCCPLTVTSGDSLASKAYETALQAVKDAHCSIECPNLACSTKPSNNCESSASCAQ